MSAPLTDRVLVDLCVNPSCLAMNRRADNAPTPLACPSCGQTTLLPETRLTDVLRTEANARLFEAAPALIAACRDSLPVLREVFGKPDMRYSLEIHAVIEALEAAVLKATGEVAS